MTVIFTFLKKYVSRTAITFLTLFASNAWSQVMINEYSCSNLTSFVDNYGGYEDWIELYNAGSSPVNLAGYHLSDNAANIGKWTFGSATINANGFLRIWASGHNVVTGTLHTNFTLTQCKGDAIIFSDASNTVLDSFTVKRTQIAHSRGRTTNGAATWSVFTTPTPGGSNNTATAWQNYATTPSMNVAPGFYSGAQTITITSPDPNITIHYTTNGSTPTTASPVYSSPINVATTTVVRAKAFSSTSNIPASFVESNTYFINSPHTVNVVSIFGDQVATLMGGTQIDPETGVEYFDSSGTFKTEGYGTSNKHGNDSWSYPQRGIDFICRDEYGYNYALLHRFFGVSTRSEFQRVIFKAAANDNYPFECPAAGNPNAWGDPTLYDAAHIRDAYVETVAQKAGMHLDVRSWAPMIMYVNGQYWGVYDLREKVDDKDFCGYYDNAKSDSLQFLKNWGGITIAYGGNQAQTDWNNLHNYIVSNNMAVQANYNVADAQLNIKSLVDYFLINSYSVTSDWLNWNSEWWRGTNVNCSKRKWRYCLWDEDATFHHYINYTGIPNNNVNASPCDPQTLNPSPPDYGGNIDIWNALMANPGFQQYYILRYYDLINTGLSCQRMTQILDSMITVITPEMQGQVARWGGSVAAWQQNVQDLRNFILQRCDSIAHQFNNCYNVTGPYTIKVNVDPPGSGTVDFSTNHLTSFVWSGLYPGNVTVGISENPNPGYCFDHWEFKNHTPLPSTTSQSVTVQLITTDSIVAHFIPTPQPIITPSSAQICPGLTVSLTASQGQTYTWSPATNLSCTTCTTTIASPTVTTTYTLATTYSTGCVSTNTVLVTVTPMAPPVITPSNTTICPGQTVALSAAQGTYTWSPATGLSCTTCSSTNASPSSSQTYTLTKDSAGCTSSDFVTVNVSPLPPPFITPLNAQICPGESVTLTGSQGQNLVWSPPTNLSCTSCTATVASPVVTTIYTLTASSPPCTSTRTVSVVVIPAAVASFSNTAQNNSLPVQVQFVSTSTLSTGCSWAFSNGQTGTGCTPTITFDTPGTYTVTLIAQGASGCNDTLTKTILISDTAGLIMPTVFTPNGDGINDYFQPIARNVGNFSCSIFDRWGRIVFEFQSTTDKWFGQNTSGGTCPDGTYYYIMEAKDNNGKEYKAKGFITLMR